MKSLTPWFCLAAITNATVAFAENGLEAYRLGEYNQAANLLSNNANQDPVTQYYLAKMYLYGYGELKNDTLAIEYFKTAAEKGLLPAQKIMAQYELMRKDNLPEALNWFKKAAAANDVPSQMYCAAAYLFGLGTPKNADTAKRYYIAAAKNGNSIAQYTVAASFLETHQSANKKLGLLWLNRAVEQRNPEAQVMMSEQYLNGGVVDKNNDKAKELAQLAVDQNYVPGFYQMGRVAQSLQQIDEAVKWYTKASEAQFAPALMALAQLRLDAKNPLYNPQEGFLWMLKAAQGGSIKAQQALADLYAKGIGTDLNEALAKEWKDKAVREEKTTAEKAKIQAVQWLTDRKSTQFSETQYALRGILGAWQNARDTQQNNYNQAPQMETPTRNDLFKPQFVMVSPTSIPISEYYNLLVGLTQNQQATFDFPRYGLGVQTDATSDKQSIPLEQISGLSSSDQATYQTLFKKLEAQAILGDASAQFDIGQMYQYGIGVKKDVQEAIRYYQLAAAQQELRSEYNLGLLYLTSKDIQPDYQLAIDWLNDAAFKGNDFAQFTLASIYDAGYRDPQGKEVIKASPDDAWAMYNLAAANGSGLAQYRLAEIIVRQKSTDLNVATLKKRHQLIKGLYTSAVTQGIPQAVLPLAFYNAMDQDPAKQQSAFAAAKKAANEGNTEAALLLGLMYDRGIGTEVNQGDAFNWYQRAKENPVGAFIIGSYLAEGVGSAKDLIKARELLDKAAASHFSYAHLNLAILKQQQQEVFMPDLEQAVSSGNSTAGLLLADYYLSQLNDQSKLKSAREIYQRFAEKGDKDAQLKLGYLSEHGIGGTVDAAEAERFYKQAAEQKQPIAQYLLANMYQLGKLSGTPNYEEAKHWYAIAQTNYPPAAIALGFIYDTEDENYDKAMGCYQSALDRSDMIAAYNLGLIYERGEGRAVDIEKAKDLYLKAAEKGHRQAIVQLAGIYLHHGQHGWDAREAFSWYKKASDLGDRDAMYQLGLMSETGVGTRKNVDEAIRYYRLAAEKGHAKASLALARMYQYGLGVTKDIQASAKIYTNLASLGNPYAQYQLGMFCFKGMAAGCLPAEGKQWLEKAQKNGSLEAYKSIQWTNAQSQPQVSFIEPIQFGQQNIIQDTSSADLMYLDALNAWNVGDESRSKAILLRLLDQHPGNELAKQAYQQLLSADASLESFNAKKT